MRHILGALALVTAALCTTPAPAQQYPSRTVTIVAGYAPGSSSDLLARTLGEALQAKWGQPVVVENRPGSGSNIAAHYVARSAPDGYTLMVVTDATLTSNVFLYNAVPFDPVKDFAPIIKAADNVIVLAVNPKVPAKSVSEFISHAKANPGKVTYGSSGTGSPHHLAGELLSQLTGVQMSHVPYKGGGPAVNDLVGGHISAAFLSLSAARPLHDTGKIRILGSVEKSRYAEMPDVPVIAETVPGFEMTSWMGLVAPAGTPPAIVSQLNETITAVLKSPDVIKKLGTLGLAVSSGSPQELADTIKTGLDVRGKLVKAAGIKPE